MEDCSAMHLCCTVGPLHCQKLIHGTFCAANWLILANFDPNFVTLEISGNKVRKCWPGYGGGVYQSKIPKMVWEF